VRDRGAADENPEDEEPQGCGHTRPERIGALGPRGRWSRHRRSRSTRGGDRFFERRAHALPKLGIDERKLRTDRFPGHAYGFSLKAAFPRLLRRAREQWQVRLKRSTARLNDADS